MRQRWLSGRALRIHLALAVWFPGCLIAFWWQVHRAFSGNGLSYVYSVEWPVFALIGVWAWWQLVHTDPATVGRRAQERMAAAAAGRATRPARGDVASRDAPPAATLERGAEDGVVRPPVSEDPELAAYNERLAQLATEGPKTWRRR